MVGMEMIGHVKHTLEQLCTEAFAVKTSSYRKKIKEGTVWATHHLHHQQPRSPA